MNLVPEINLVECKTQYDIEAYVVGIFRCRWLSNTTHVLKYLSSPVSLSYTKYR